MSVIKPIRNKKTGKVITNAEWCQLVLDVDKAARKEAEDNQELFKPPFEAIDPANYQAVLDFCQYVVDGKGPREQQRRFVNGLDDRKTRMYGLKQK